MCCICALRRGPQAADYCRQHLPHVLAECSKAAANPQQALKDTFLRLDAGETRGAGQGGSCKAVQGCACGARPGSTIASQSWQRNLYSAVLKMSQVWRWQG